MMQPYRTNAAEPPTPRWPYPRRRWWTRLLCRLRGHDWTTLRVNRRKFVGLVHLHPLAGCDAQCARCGEIWDDAPWAARLVTPTDLTLTPEEREEILTERVLLDAHGGAPRLSEWGPHA